MRGEENERFAPFRRVQLFRNRLGYAFDEGARFKERGRRRIDAEAT